MQQMNNISYPDSPDQSNPDPFTPAGRPQGEGWRSIISTLLLLLAAPLIALVLISFVFQSYEVDGPSMESALQHQDRLVVLKTGKTWSRVSGQPYIPKRGDIIVFAQGGLGLLGGGDQKQLIKRVIALPGERVIVKDGTVTVFNDKFPGGFRPDETGGYEITVTHTSGNVNVTVPDAAVFVMGDNRNNSHDSRDFGPVDSSDIVGSLALRIFPLNKVDAY